VTKEALKQSGKGDSSGLASKILDSTVNQECLNYYMKKNDLFNA